MTARRDICFQVVPELEVSKGFKASTCCLVEGWSLEFLHAIAGCFLRNHQILAVLCRLFMSFHCRDCLLVLLALLS